MELGVDHVLLMIVFLPDVYCNIKWMALEKYKPEGTNFRMRSVCSRENGFNLKQLRFCKNNFQWMRFVHDSASEVVGECQNLLYPRKWNCHSINKAPTFDADLRKVTKEAAFVYALSSASLALKIANGCMAGRVADCACRLFRPRPTQLSVNSTSLSDYQGYQAHIFPANKLLTSNVNNMVPCKGILEGSIHMARSFTRLGFPLKWRTDKHRVDTVVRMHNMDVGLQELKDKESIKCKCTGITGGCVYKFCHRRVVPFNKIGTNLLKKYDSAVKVDYPPVVLNTVTKTRKKKDVTTHKKDVPSDKNDATSNPIRQNQKDKLVYLTALPDHCTEGNPVLGRQCSLDNSAVDSCRQLCCRGYREKRIEVHSECRCQFVYCCRVDCDTCISFKNIHQCL